MPRPPRQSTPGGVPAQDRQYTLLTGMLALWDMSRHPTTNDLRRKLGKADKVAGTAVVGYIDKHVRSIVADGITNERRKLATYPLDPNNWIPRKHGAADGDGEYGVWSLRLVADAANQQARRACESTMVVDGDADQAWAWLSDYLRVVEPNGGAPLSDDALKVDAAGFLPDLYDKLTSFGKPNRAALGAALYRNLGFVTDGGHVGQWSHVFTFPSDAAADVTTPSGGSGSTGHDTGANGVDTGVEFIEPPNKQFGGGRPTSPAELCLRSDVKFRFPGGLMRFPAPTVMPTKAADSGEVREVYLAKTTLGAPEDAGLDTSNDPNCNHVKIPKDALPAKFAWWVKVPTPGGCDCQHYDDSYHHNPPENGDGSSGGGSSFPPYGGYGDDGVTPPDPEADPDDIDGDGDFDDDDVNHRDYPRADAAENYDGIPPSERAADMGSRQVQHGYAPPNSPAFSQRFNVHDYVADAFTVGTMVRTKPPGYTTLSFALELRPSEAIPLGQEIELQVIVMPSYGGVPPQDADLKTVSVTLTSETSTDEWTRYMFQLKNFERAPASLLVLFVRRNDLPTPAPTVELWRRFSRILYKA